MAAYEYKSLKRFGPNSQEQKGHIGRGTYDENSYMNMMSAEGWELVTVIPAEDPTHTIFYWKRVKI